MDPIAGYFTPPLPQQPESDDYEHDAYSSQAQWRREGHVNDQNLGYGEFEESNENVNAHGDQESRRVYEYGDPTTHLPYYPYQGEAAVIVEDPFDCSPYEQLANYDSVPFGDVHGDFETESGDPATMVYDWEGKEELCYKLYITENKSLEEIMEFFKVNDDFTPR